MYALSATTTTKQTNKKKTAPYFCSFWWLLCLLVLFLIFVFNSLFSVFVFMIRTTIICASHHCVFCVSPASCVAAVCGGVRNELRVVSASLCHSLAERNNNNQHKSICKRKKTAGKTARKSVMRVCLYAPGCRGEIRTRALFLPHANSIHAPLPPLLVGAPSA
jgi:hypothetical protein